MCESNCKGTCDKKESAPVKVPHKHAELIKAWADGAQIQVNREGHWYDVIPSWASADDYRIKPEPKPDLVLYKNYCYHRVKHEVWLLLSGDLSDTQQVKWTIDGETGKIKSVELLDK